MIYVMSLFDQTAQLVPGVYRHYKGGLYTLIATALHHDKRYEVAIYVSLTTGQIAIRPLYKQSDDSDAWLDYVKRDGEPTVRRFTYVGVMAPA